MKEEHSGGGVFQRPGEFPSVVDSELPMAQEAVDYYRNGPSILQRYVFAPSLTNGSLKAGEPAIRD